MLVFDGRYCYFSTVVFSARISKWRLTVELRERIQAEPHTLWGAKTCHAAAR
jgi:hypothetical protein